MKRSGIYFFLNPRNFKFYIGSTNSFYDRKKDHLCRLRNNKHANIHMQRAFNKNKEGLIFFILEDCPVDQLDKKEQFWIDLLKPEYNIRKEAKSNRGLKQSQKSIDQRVSKTTGKKRTQEQKDRLRNGILLSYKNGRKRGGWKCKLSDTERLRRRESMLNNSRQKPNFKTK